MAPVWVCPSAAPSLNRIAAGCGLLTTLRGAQVFTSSYPPASTHMIDRYGKGGRKMGSVLLRYRSPLVAKSGRPKTSARLCRQAKAERHARVASTASVVNDPTRTLRVNSFCDAQCYFFRVRSSCGDGHVHLTRTPSRKRRTAAWTRFSMTSRVRGWRSGLPLGASPRTRLRNMSAASSGSPTLISFRSA
jgi:hypothetical protein